MLVTAVAVKVVVVVESAVVEIDRGSVITVLIPELLELLLLLLLLLLLSSPLDRVLEAVNRRCFF